MNLQVVHLLLLCGLVFLRQHSIHPTLGIFSLDIQTPEVSESLLASLRGFSNDKSYYIKRDKICRELNFFFWDGLSSDDENTSKIHTIFNN